MACSLETELLDSSMTACARVCSRAPGACLPRRVILRSPCVFCLPDQSQAGMLWMHAVHCSRHARQPFAALLPESTAARARGRVSVACVTLLQKRVSVAASAGRPGAATHAKGRRSKLAALPRRHDPAHVHYAHHGLFGNKCVPALPCCSGTARCVMSRCSSACAEVTYGAKNGV